MANLGQTFNANDVPEREEFTPVPPGQYTGIVTESTMKPTKNGEMLVLELTIQGGEYDGRKVFENLNIVNTNQQTVDIAFRTLGELCKAVGKPTIKDSSEIHNKRFLMNITVEPPKAYVDRNGVEQPGKAQNKVKKYLPVNGATSGDTATSSPSTVAEGKPADSTPPWKRSKA